MIYLNKKKIYFLRNNGVMKPIIELYSLGFHNKNYNIVASEE
jgi:hypothetical protein